jgi:hypothetical protein
LQFKVGCRSVTPEPFWDLAMGRPRPKCRADDEATNRDPPPNSLIHRQSPV